MAGVEGKGEGPEALAARIFELRCMEWRIRWAIYDACADLQDATDPGAFRTLAAEVVHTSHRNLARWASRARAVPADERDPLWAPTTHHTWRRKGWL